MCPVIRQAFHGALNRIMDIKFWLLMVAACVCGDYRNSNKLPEPYTENLAKPVEKARKERASPVPHYAQGYKEIITGKWHFRYYMTSLQ